MKRKAVAEADSEAAKAAAKAAKAADADRETAVDETWAASTFVVCEYSNIRS